MSNRPSGDWKRRRAALEGVAGEYDRVPYGRTLECAHRVGVVTTRKVDYYYTIIVVNSFPRSKIVTWGSRYLVATRL